MNTCARKSRNRFSLTRLCENLEPRLFLSATDPSPQEQELLWLLNRMRTAPAAELGLLLQSADPFVIEAMSYYGVDRNMLAEQWSTLRSAQPVAWNANLAGAATGHNVAMLTADLQSHQLPDEPSPASRFLAAGYSFAKAGENVFAYASTMEHAHAAFGIDWGPGPGGMQSPAGHRLEMMNGEYRDVGINVLYSQDWSKKTGPFLVTQDFGVVMNPGNPMLVGTVYQDDNNDNAFQAGEGLGNVTITAQGAAGTFQTVSRTAGGYQLRLPNGSYTISFSGGDASTIAGTSNIVVNGANVLLDRVARQVAEIPDPPPVVAPPPPPIPAAVSTADPVGVVDRVDAWPSNAPFRVVGWAFDLDAGANPVDVVLRVDGQAVTTGTANQARPDLTPVVGSPAHGFTLNVPALQRGSHRIEVLARDVASGSQILLFSQVIAVGPTAFGAVDAVSNQRISGWAFDPNAGEFPVQVIARLDGAVLNSTTASLPRGDLTGLLGSANHGFSLTLPTLPAGIHRLEVVALALDGQERIISSQQIGTASRPIGSLDVVDNNVLAGWAADLDSPTLPANVRIHVDGRFIRTIQTTSTRSDLATVGPGPYAFQTNTVPLTPGSHTVQLFVDDPDFGRVLVGQRSVLIGGGINQLPIGVVDTFSRTTIGGWAIDLNTPAQAVQIRLVIDGIAQALSPAIAIRPDLAPHFGTTAHGFSFTLAPMTPGAHLVEIFALDTQTQTARSLGSSLV